MHYSAGNLKIKNQNDLKVKIAAKVLFCGGCALKLNLNSSDEDFESLTVISVEHYTVRLTLPALNVSKWLTVENFC